MVHRIYPAELQLDKTNGSHNEAAYLDLKGVYSLMHSLAAKIYDIRDDFEV